MSSLKVFPNSSFLTFPIKAALDPNAAIPTAVFAADPPDIILGFSKLSNKVLDLCSSIKSIDAFIILNSSRKLSLH